MSQKAIKITGWALTIILGLVFTMSAFMKLTQNEEAIAQAAAIGLEANTYLLIGIVEITALLFFIFPKTGVLGTLLLVAYLGGAIVTHLLNQQPILVPVIIQVVLWITAIIRFPELRMRLISTKSH